jgi:hypothetical protein
MPIFRSDLPVIVAATTHLIREVERLPCEVERRRAEQLKRDKSVDRPPDEFVRRDLDLAKYALLAAMAPSAVKAVAKTDRNAIAMFVHLADLGDTVKTLDLVECAAARDIAESDIDLTDRATLEGLRSFALGDALKLRSLNEYAGVMAYLEEVVAKLSEKRTTDRPTSESGKRHRRQGGRRLGRPDRHETRAETKIIAAMCIFYSRDNRDPPQGKVVAGEARVSPMTVTNFMQKHFGGQAEFEAVWRRGDFPAKLAAIQNLLPKSHLPYDDKRSAEGLGYRRMGRAPGSHSDD